MSPLMAIGLAVMFGALGFVFRKQGTVNRTAFWLFELAAVLFLVAAAITLFRS